MSADAKDVGVASNARQLYFFCCGRLERARYLPAEAARSLGRGTPMKLDRFDAPGKNDDFAGDMALRDAWSQWMSHEFDVGVESVKQYLAAHGGGTCQFYNPVTKPLVAPDLPLTAGDIPWNGFPKRHGAAGPGQPPQYAKAEALVSPGTARDQDEYLEWFVNRKDGKILSVHFTCEAWDYFEFLALHARTTLVKLYKTWIGQNVQEADLFPNGRYDRLNKWNTQLGAMHLTHSANNLFAEVFLAATATVRRKQHGAELTASIPLITCGQYGDETRNSDPAIGAAVNGLARDGRQITLANPVGLYMAAFDGNGLTLNGQPAGGFFKVVRGALPFGLRAIYELPPPQAAQGLTVSDVKIGGTPIQFGGQLAQRITMHLLGVASVAQDVHNVPVSVCGAVPEVDVPNPPAALAAAAPRFARRMPPRA
jgi:hypothetical protein